jgi:hypothetical protein
MISTEGVTPAAGATVETLVGGVAVVRSAFQQPAAKINSAMREDMSFP